MYSDFVGVTYNMTHAKYQACITHYRKQHYLGRYRLAVDASLAYDESARLLKGASWKVNFRDRGEYESARAKERGSAAAEAARPHHRPDGGIAAVATKVGEIARAVAGGAFRGPDARGIGGRGGGGAGKAEWAEGGGGGAGTGRWRGRPAGTGRWGSAGRCRRRRR
jgi:hypothetical protein